MSGGTLPKLVATDLDGTLLGPDGTVSARTRRVLQELDARGVPVVFVTGRPVRWMDALWVDVGGHGLAVCSNGGIVYDVTRRQVRSALTVPRDVALDVATTLRHEAPGTMFALEKTTGFARETGFVTPHSGAPDVPSGELDAIFDEFVVKMLAFHAEQHPEVYWRQARELIGDKVEVTWSSQFALLEMSARGVTKASTLARLCAQLDIGPDDVVAFGDMPNDIDMLQWAGRSWAMAGGHPDAHDAADEVAPGNDEDGVATVLADLFGLGAL